MADLVMRCSKRNMALPPELGIDLPDEGFLVGLGAEQEFGPLLHELSINALCVWSAYA